MKPRYLAILALAAVFAVGLIVLLRPADKNAKAPVVLAAASLQEAMGDAADAWAAQGHVRPVISFAASSALARQIAAGAPADMFIAADEEWMDYVAAQKRIRSGTRADFLTNRLVLVAPVSRRTDIAIAPGFPLARTLGTDRLAMADPDAVPAGKYGRAALESLGVWNSVAPKLARAENVRAALALVERGAAPLGIVYASDAKASDKVRVVGVFPESSHPPIVYPLALLASSQSADAAGFRAFLLSPQAARIFIARGFSVATE